MHRVSPRTFRSVSETMLLAIMQTCLLYYVEKRVCVNKCRSVSKYRVTTCCYKISKLSEIIDIPADHVNLIVPFPIDTIVKKSRGHSKGVITLPNL